MVEGLITSIEILGVFDSNEAAVNATKPNDMIIPMMLNDSYGHHKFTSEEIASFRKTIEFPHGKGPLRDELMNKA